MIPHSPDAYRLLHEGSLAFSQIEASGMRIDVPLLTSTIAKVKKRIADLTERLKDDEVYKLWRKTYGTEMKLGSGPQLAHILFDIMKVPPPSRTKTGKYRTDEGSLEKIKGVPFLDARFEIKKLEKLLSTNLYGIRRETVDGFLRPVFNLHTVLTFRSSSDTPNFQNFPKRNKMLEKLCRRLFIPRDEHKLVEIDLKANEVRLACCVTGDQKLISDTLEGDMHGDMAAECYLLPRDKVPKNARQVAKGMFVFAEFFGDYYKKVGPNLYAAIEHDGLTTVDGVPLDRHLASKGLRDVEAFTEHIRKVEDDFWNIRYKTYTAWKNKIWQEYQQQGWVQYPTGFVYQGIYSKNQVLNAPIQGSAFHCLLWVLIELNKWMRKNKMKSMIVGQVHDSINVDAHNDELDDVVGKAFELLRYDIRKAWPWLICPLEGEASVGQNWYEMEGIEVAA